MESVKGKVSPGKKTGPKRNPEEEIHEYPVIGKYRVRVLKKETSRTKQTMLDIREYVSADTFEGFTRRGVRLTAADEVHKLYEVLADVVKRGWFEPGEEEKGAA